MRRGASHFSDAMLRGLHRAASEAPRVRSEDPALNAVTLAYAALRVAEDIIQDYKRDARVLGDDFVKTRIATLVADAQPHIEAVKTHIKQANDDQLAEWGKRQYGPLVKDVHPAIVAEIERRAYLTPSGFVPPSLVF